MTEGERPKLGAVLLAAGSSSRLGRPKQLLKIDGETLLRRAARRLSDSVYFPVVVVLGTDAESMSGELAGLPVYRVTNGEWAAGMSSSIRKGLEKALELQPDIEGILLTLCDQPLITTEMLDRFSARYAQTQAPVIASSYRGTLGVPALFSKNLFDELFALKGEAGARQTIRSRPDAVAIELPEAAEDIDTMDDLVRLANGE